MKRFKSVICVLIAICCLLSLSNVFAVEDGLNNKATNECNNLRVSTDNVVIESNGYSEFVDVFATLDDSSEKNVNYDAIWETDNENVAIAFEGRILAKGKGQAKIKVSYGGCEKDINVDVLEQTDLFKEAKQFNEVTKKSADNSSVTPFSLSSSERQAIYDRAMTMLSYVWTPTRNLSKRGGGTFSAGTSYLGIPYTQVNQVDRDGFIAAMSKSDFYTPQPYVKDGTTLYQPKYGNDCSGFTSFSWNISRKTTADFYSGIGTTYPKVGSYSTSSPTTTQLLNSYPLLQMGDAVVYREGSGGHVFIIAVNFTNESKVQAFEQAGPLCNITYWTYSQLAAQGYRPFTK